MKVTRRVASLLAFLVLLFLAIFLYSTFFSQQAIQPTHYKSQVFNSQWNAGQYASQLEKFFLVGEQGSIIHSNNGSNWQPSHTPTTNTLHAIDSNANLIVAVGDSATILVSKDKGQTWQNANVMIPDGAVEITELRLNKVIYDANKKVWLAAGTHNSILYSNDNAKNWKLTSFNNNEDNQEIINLFIEKHTGDILFAAQDSIIGRSNDGGLHWTITQHDLKPNGDYLPHVVEFYQFDRLLIAAADNGRLLVSDNSGKDWSLKLIPTGGYFTGAAFDPKHNIIAMTTQMGEVAISHDQGNTWQLIEFSIANWPSDDVPFLTDIYYDQPSRSLLVVGNSGVVARSSDGGKNWMADIYRPLFNKSVTTVLHKPNTNTYVAAGLGGVIVKSESLGGVTSPTDNWQLIRPGIDVYIRQVQHIPDTSVFVAVGQLGGIWRSADDGKTWQEIAVDYPFNNQPPHLRDIVWDAETASLIAAGPTGCIMRSTDQGLTWQSVFQGEIYRGEAFTQLLFNPTTNDWLASEVLYRSVYHSSNGGKSWSQLSRFDSNQRNLWHAAVTQKTNITVIVGQQGGIGVSFDAGKNWQMAETNISNELYGAFADEDEQAKPILIAVGEQGTILRSENAIDWQLAQSPSKNTLRRVIKDPVSKAYLAFGQQGTILRSLGQGKSWQLVNQINTLGELRASVIDPNNKAIILVGENGSVLISSDGGVTWNQINSQTKKHFRSVTINPNTQTLIAVGENLVRLTLDD